LSLPILSGFLATPLQWSFPFRAENEHRAFDLMGVAHDHAYIELALHLKLFFNEHFFDFQALDLSADQSFCRLFSLCRRFRELDTPALNLPVAQTCAFTTQGLPISSAIFFAPEGLSALLPFGTGIPLLLKTSLPDIHKVLPLTASTYESTFSKVCI